jgi:hypothetical protein
MKLTTVLGCVNNNPDYYMFVPKQILFWAQFGIRFVTVFVGEAVPVEIKDCEVILWSKNADLNPAYVAQNMRLYYPALLQLPEDEAVMITDMDMLPMSPGYYKDGLEAFGTRDFVYYRHIDGNQVYMCYNAAHPTAWAAVFGVHSEADVEERLASNYPKYTGVPGETGWYTDQLVLYQKLSVYPHFQVLNRPLRRLEMDAFTFRSDIRDYDDAHFHRNYFKHVYKIRHAETQLNPKRSANVVFSFCVYGSNPKYCQGMVENLRILETRFPECKVYIYLGNDVPPHYVETYSEFPTAVLVPVDSNNADLMAWRFFALEQPGVQCMFPRDADSRVHDRDEWCVRQFLASDKLLHICRDHYWHKTKITGGIWGMKKTVFNLEMNWHEWRASRQPCVYDDDQKFLAECVYPNFTSAEILIHSNIVGHLHEHVTPIPRELFSETHFMCNTWDYKDGVEYPVFTYSNYPLMEHVHWLQDRDQFRLMAEITASVDIYSVRPAERTKLLDAMFIASFYLGDYVRCAAVFEMFRSTHVDDHVLHNSNFLIPKLKKRVVGTTCAKRQPREDEMVICYGKYPMDARALPSGNKMYRNALYYSAVAHDVFEHHPCWAEIGVIYVLNLVERRDRFTEIMAELCAVGAPLDRVYHYKAEKLAVTGTKSVDAYLGATKNHLDVVAHFKRQEGPKNCLILEDDFMFNSNVADVQIALQTFLSRKYDYDVCLLATSKFGDIRPHDDLLNTSHQECTTTSAYLLNRDTCEPVLECFQEGYKKMKQTGDSNTYVCDRYWSRLQPRNRMFVFKDKLGYQRCGFSSILNETSGFNFD